MRKSSLVKAMACFMAATMAITCMPSANVTNGVSVVAQAAIAENDSTTSDEEISLDTAAWNPNAKSYQLTGDFCVKLTLANQGGTSNWCNPVFEIVNADSTKGYTIRNDSYGWSFGEDTDAYAPTYTSDWADWNEFLAMMKDATIDVQISRKGDTYTISEVIKSNVTGYGTYHYSVSFSSASLGEVNQLHIGGEACTIVIESFANLAEFVNYTAGTDLPDGVELDDDGVYVITPETASWATVSTTDPTKYDVDLSNLFKTTDKKTVAVQEENSIDIKVNGNKQTFTYKIAPTTYCQAIAVTKGNNTVSSKDVSFDVEVSLTPQSTDSTQVVTEPVNVEFSGVAAEYKKKKNKNTYVFTITPTEAGTGTATFSCGNATPQTINFEVYGNKCVSLVSSKGETYADGTVSFYSKANQATTFTVIATGEDSKQKPSGEIELKSVTGSSIIQVASTSAVLADNQIGVDVTAYVAEGTNELYLECANQSLKVNITGTKDSTAEGTTGTTTGSTGTTTTPADTTETPGAADTTTGSAVDTTAPADTTTTPDDTTTPADTTTTPDDTTTPADTTTTPDDTTTPADTATDTSTTTKKNAKISSVTAKSGKKVVSGKVTKKATVKVTVNKKTVKTTADKNGKFSVTVAKKLTKGTKVKVVVTKSGYKKATKTVTVK